MALYRVRPVNAEEQETMSRDPSILCQAPVGRPAGKSGAVIAAGWLVDGTGGRHDG